MVAGHPQLILGQYKSCIPRTSGVLHWWLLLLHQWMGILSVVDSRIYERTAKVMVSKRSVLVQLLMYSLPQNVWTLLM